MDNSVEIEHTTRFDTERVTFTWRIGNYSKCLLGVNECIQSSSFHCGNASWHLDLYPRGQTKNPRSTGFVNIYLVKNSNFTHSHEVTVRISLKDKDNQDFNPFETHVIVNNEECVCGKPYFVKRTALLNKLRKILLPEDTLTVCCKLSNFGSITAGLLKVGNSVANAVTSSENTAEISPDNRTRTNEITVDSTGIPGETSATEKLGLAETSFYNIETDAGISRSDTSITKEEETVNSISTSENMIAEDDKWELDGEAGSTSPLSKDMDELFRSHKWSDVTLRASQRNFPAIKALLAVRSSVFADIFEQDMERLGSVVDISDIDSAALEPLLRYIYTGQIDKLNVQKAMELFTAAHKYAVEDLREECLHFISRTLSVDNVCDVAYLADTYGEKRLQSVASDFVRKNTADVLSKSQWRSLVRERPLLASDIIEAITLNFSHSTKNESSLSFVRPLHMESLSRDLQRLFETRKWCDVTLKAGDQDFPVHKSILAARSLVFSAMFEHDMSESRTGVVEILGIEAPVIEELLHYIYNGETGDLTLERIQRLFPAADRYQVQDLKEDCIQFLLQVLSPDNACDIAVLADTYSEDFLKERAKDMVLRNTSSVLSTNQWKNLLRERPFLASHIMEAIAANLISKT